MFRWRSPSSSSKFKSIFRTELYKNLIRGKYLFGCSTFTSFSASLLSIPQAHNVDRPPPFSQPCRSLFFRCSLCALLTSGRDLPAVFVWQRFIILEGMAPVLAFESKTEVFSCEFTLFLFSPRLLVSICFTSITGLILYLQFDFHFESCAFHSL